MVRVTRSLVLCAMFCRSLFVLLSFFFWPLCSLSFFDLLILITPLYLQTLLNINLYLRHNNPLPHKFSRRILWDKIHGFAVLSISLLLHDSNRCTCYPCIIVVIISLFQLTNCLTSILHNPCVVTGDNCKSPANTL